jgi:Fe-Mn family superoxide dismutase
MGMKTYKARQFDLSGLTGISDKTLEMHFKLYEGYVANTNALTDKLAGYFKTGNVEQADFAAYSELTRRLGFEYNGMVLHEYYFGNMKKQGGGDPGQKVRAAIETSFASVDVWRNDFVGIGKMRGVGWAIAYVDPATGWVSNHWINLHETNNVAGFVPLLVMDVWEHAFLLDYKPAERPKYIDAFLANVDWSCVEKRLDRVHVSGDWR